MNKISAIVADALSQANAFAPGDPAVTDGGEAFGTQLAAEVLRWEEENGQPHDSRTRDALPNALLGEVERHPDDRVRTFLDAAVMSYERHLSVAPPLVRRAPGE